ncbi:MAG TPA: helix-turn-helix transcriptional regulator [Spirochaetia bacterium]|nr:helix-turn-helix transcriptional regulator [Spirochaetia bacterium]
MDDFERHLQKSLKDPEFRAAWEESEAEYQAISQLVALRIKKGLTQKSLAHRIGTTQSVIARIEGGNQNISLRTLGKLAKALDANVRIELQTEEPEPGSTVFSARKEGRGGPGRKHRTYRAVEQV